MLFKNKAKILDHAISDISCCKKINHNTEAGFWKRTWLVFKSNTVAVFSLYLLALIVLFVIVAPMLSPNHYDTLNWDVLLSKPTWKQAHLFGTDSVGRDLLVRLALGGRISLAVGFSAAMVAIVIGTLYGTISGLFGGVIDSIMMRILEILNAIPFIFFVILLITFFGKNLFLIFVSIGMISWLDMARIVRGQTLSIKKQQFIEAAEVIGVSRLQIIFRHLIPNLLGIVLVYASLLVPQMILFESFLSFLGLGVQEPMSSWGSLLNEGANSMQIAPWLLIFPAVFLVMTLFCFNFIGDGLRDALDPKEKR